MKASIFNDVIGPVMRGASSSHVAAAARIGRIISESCPMKIRKVDVFFDINGSLAESYQGHGSDIGLISGLLKIDLTDSRVLEVLEIVKKEMEINFHIGNYQTKHPNNYKIDIYYENGEVYTWEAISTGGGMIKVYKLDEFIIESYGDFYEYLFFIDNTVKIKEYEIKKIVDYEYLYEKQGQNRKLLQIKTNFKLEKEQELELEKLLISKLKFRFIPILPVLSSKSIKLPFDSITSLLKLSETEIKGIDEFAIEYESARGNISREEVLHKMNKLIEIFVNCRNEGIKKREYKDRILTSQAYLIEEKKELLIPTELINNMIKNITAIMEVKSSMGIIVAAPTAGSCGCLPGTLLAIAETYNMAREKLIKGFLAAGIIGVFIAEKATFAAEIAGCQVECGSGSAMAAAGITAMFDGSVKQCIDAASIAFQNITGLVCDPVANRVEVPCLGKNIMGGSNSIVSSTMALAGYDVVIPLEEVIESVLDIGKKLPSELRCTFGGLGKTKTSLKIRKILEENN